MSETAKRVSDREAEAATQIMNIFSVDPELSMAAMFNTMRILKRVNQGDTYYENYLGMKAKYGDKFFDTYQVLWAIGAYIGPKRILEIGMRTGISICQLLSSHAKFQEIERVVGVDPFDAFTSANLVRANLKYLNIDLGPRLTIHSIKSQEFFRDIERKPSFDFILVDGDHSKQVAKFDLDEAHILLEPGGIIVFDDISTAPGECALIDVWEAWKTEHAEEYQFAEVMDGKGVAVAIKL